MNSIAKFREEVEQTCLIENFTVTFATFDSTLGRAKQGVPKKTRAEIIPIEPDAGNADEGRQSKHVSKVHSPMCLRV
jgi:hypothetical protein